MYTSYKFLKIHQCTPKATSYPTSGTCWHTVGKDILVQIFPFTDNQLSSACPQDYQSHLPTINTLPACPGLGAVRDTWTYSMRSLPSGWYHWGRMRVAWLDQNLALPISKPALYSPCHQTQHNVTTFSVCFLRNRFLSHWHP